MKRLVSLFTVVVLSWVWMVGASQAADPVAQSVLTQLQALRAQIAGIQEAIKSQAPFSPRKYFLTKETFLPPDGLTKAHGNGYHFASLFEILDPTNLRYASDNPQAYSPELYDLGSGPPAGIFGWVRTGSPSGADPFDQIITGHTNCDLWTSTEDSKVGTTAALPNDWFPSLGANIDNRFLIAPWWNLFRDFCNVPLRVWCV